MIRNGLHLLARKAEATLDRFKPRASGPLFLDPYLGYTTTEHVILKGRVLSAATAQDTDAPSSILRNFRAMLDRFKTDEVADVEVRHAAYSARTDEEGYFDLLLPREDRIGILSYPITLEDGTTAHCEAYTPRPDAPALVISDIDDTMMRTGAHSLLRNLWTTFSGSVGSRHVFPDAVSLMRLLSGDLDLPVYYVSSSPWNLHAFLQAVFARAGLPKAPMFLRDLGIDEDKFITDGHGSHKGRSIDLILAAHPGVPAVLIGDSGQKDAVIYHAAIERHPGRIAAVLLRTAQDGLDTADNKALAALKATGVPTFAGDEFAPFEDELHALLNPAAKLQEKTP